MPGSFPGSEYNASFHAGAETKSLTTSEQAASPTGTKVST
jgi:hypothetical protein